MSDTVYITFYHGRWPEDDFAIGNVYFDKEEAEAVVEEQSDTERDFYGGYVEERKLK